VNGSVPDEVRWGVVLDARAAVALPLFAFVPADAPLLAPPADGSTVVVVVLVPPLPVDFVSAHDGVCDTTTQTWAEAALALCDTVHDVAIGAPAAVAGPVTCEHGAIEPPPGAGGVVGGSDIPPPPGGVGGGGAPPPGSVATGGDTGGGERVGIGAGAGAATGMVGAETGAGRRLTAPLGASAAATDERAKGTTAATAKPPTSLAIAARCISP